MIKKYFFTLIVFILGINFVAAQEIPPDFRNLIMSGCNLEKCPSVQCSPLEEIPSGCKTIKRCCCEEIDCSSRGENLGRELKLDYILNNICAKNKNIIMSDNWEVDEIFNSLSKLNHCHINSDCGVLYDLPCCLSESFILINKNEDFCFVKDDLEKLISLSKSSSCKCSNTSIPKPKDLRCIEHKCILKPIEEKITSLF